MHSLRFTAESSSNGVVERDFTVGGVPGVLWSCGLRRSTRRSGLSALPSSPAANSARAFVNADRAPDLDLSDASEKMRP